MKIQGGLLSFNNFLSTSQNRKVSLDFVRRSMATSNLVGVLFVLEINPSMSATTFANVGNVGYYQGEEEEILFSMHSVFRVGEVKQIDKNDRLWQVNLTLTSENDPRLHALTKTIRKEIYPHCKGWLRLGMLLIKLGQFNKAQQVYEILLNQTSNDREKSDIYYQLGWTKDEQGEYADAIAFYEKSIAIGKVILPPNHVSFATSYNNMGNTYNNMGEYLKAISYYEKALEIYQKNLPPEHPDLATCYNCHGSVYYKMGEHSKALSYYEKALEIRQKILPANHPSLATSYSNIGNVYFNMGEYSKALWYYDKDLAISQNILPPNHPELATSYVCHGFVYEKMGEYSKALSYLERALHIRQHSLPTNHPHLQNVREKIEMVKKKL